MRGPSIVLPSFSPDIYYAQYQGERDHGEADDQKQVVQVVLNFEAACAVTLQRTLRMSRAGP